MKRLIVAGVLAVLGILCILLPLSYTTVSYTHLDYRLKTSYDDPQRLVEQLILSLAEARRHG